jgi:hypothetical protein
MFSVSPILCAASVDKNTETTKVNHLSATTTVTVQNLEHDHQSFKNQIGTNQQRFQNLSTVGQSFEELVQENEILKKVKYLKGTVAEYESDIQKYQ